MDDAEEGFDDGFDDGRGALALPAPEGAGDGIVASPWRRRFAVVAGVACAASAAAGFLAWRSSADAPSVAVALAGIEPEVARERLAAASIRCEVRDGAAWVSQDDVRRAVDACGTAARPGNPVADALDGESIFASGESVRARRTAATLRMLESAIAMQPGVERASVVVGEPVRTAGPGGVAGSAASVTVSMRSGRMAQDLVDAVAMLVAGACPGVRPEAVVIVDAGEGRVRVARDAAVRAQVDAARARESAAEAVIASLLSDLPVADVRVRESAQGAVVATVELARDEALMLARAAGTGMAEWVAAERGRTQERIAPFVGVHDGCAFALQLVVAPADPIRSAMGAPAVTLTESSPAEGPMGTRSAATPATDERSMPLGPSTAAGGFPFGWLAVLLCGAGVAGAAWWMRARRQAQADGAANWDDAEDPVPGVDDSGLEHAELSADVARAVPASAQLLSQWASGGRAVEAAHVVVALEAAAASAVLQAMPVTEVKAVTAALSTLESPAPREIDSAARRFAAELQLSLRVHGDPLQEAA
jgi:type III secretory pathway lipoprotein EscJ